MTTETRSIDLKNRSIGSEPPETKAALRIPNLFGSSVRAEVLVMIAGLGRTYPRELARLVERPISLIQKVVNDLELAGVLATSLRGKLREVYLNPDYIAARELAELLQALIDREPRYANRLAEAARRRPRRAGKAL